MSTNRTSSAAHDPRLPHTMLAAFSLLLFLSLIPTPANAQHPVGPWDADPGTANRVAGQTPAEYAVQMARSAHPEFGVSSIAIVSGEEFADGLSASGLGAQAVFFARAGQPLDADQLAEIQRLAMSFTEVFLLGGPAAVDRQVEAQMDELALSWQRLEGSDRVATALAVADHIFAPDFRDPGDIFLARSTGEGTAAWADSIAAAGSVASAGAALLLTRTSGLDDRVAQWLQTNRPARVTLLGGPAALGPEVLQAVEALGIPARRIAGPSRDVTATAISRQVGASSFLSIPARVTLVNLYDEDGWAYALATAAPAFQSLIATVNPASTPVATQSLIACGPPSDVVIAGPESVIPQAAADAARTCPDGGSFGVDPDAPLSLRGDGLGDTMFFGARVDVVLERLGAIYGPPTDDTGWLDDACPLAGPEDPPARYVSFGDRLTVGFRETHGIQYFESWSVRGDAITLDTPEGVGAGSSNADVRAAYGSSGTYNEYDPDEFPPPFWSIDAPHGSLTMFPEDNGNADLIQQVRSGGPAFCE